jgi:hypothetical protein
MGMAFRETLCYKVVMPAGGTPPYPWIIVIERPDDYRAELENRPEIWAMGRTPEDAVAKLIGLYPERFAVAGVKWPR